MILRLVSSFASGCLFAATAFGQGAVTVVTTNGSLAAGSTTAGPRFAAPAVTGAPFSGEEVTERVQTLADGTHITQTMPGRRLFRDSQGRTRAEQSLGIPGRPDADAPRMIQITDSVAGFQYTLDAQNKVAHRSALWQPNQPNAVAIERNTPWFSADAPPPPPPPSGAPSATASRLMGAPAQDDHPQPEFKNEYLGTQTIDGVLCDGVRATITYPTDFQGNDRPIVVTRETWQSPDLKVVILTKTNDPRSGESTFEIRNLSRSEPDASLFQPPPDYSVVDDTGPVTVNLGK